ncbi:MAG: 4-hydroxy-tetrahydrodipicolinate reductase [Oscillospiraceae bacterium]
MLNVIICGILGNMGGKVMDACFETSDISVAAGIDMRDGTLASIPLFASPSQCTIKSDVLIDFSTPSLAFEIADLCAEQKMPLVMCTTGHTGEQLERLAALATVVPVFKSANMSLGIALLEDLVKRAAAVLGAGFDIEITEKHHRRKVDAPSGTALMLADAINAERGNRYDYTYERHSVREPRLQNEIGIHSLRGGTIVGDHEVCFAGNDEILTLAHSASSRAVFAEGALSAARFIVRQKPGSYDMKSLVSAF